MTLDEDDDSMDADTKMMKAARSLDATALEPPTLK
jgi:hypothetical protein